MFSIPHVFYFLFFFFLLISLQYVSLTTHLHSSSCYHLYKQPTYNNLFLFLVISVLSLKLHFIKIWSSFKNHNAGLNRQPQQYKCLLFEIQIALTLGIHNCYKFFMRVIVINRDYRNSSILYALLFVVIISNVAPLRTGLLKRNLKALPKYFYSWFDDLNR